MSESKYYKKVILENGSQIINTTINIESKIYKESKVVDSFIGPNSSVGDFSHILNSKLIDSVKINRRGQIVNTTIDFASHTNHNTTIRDTNIAKFCSISWNVSIGGTDHNYKSASTFNPYWWNEYFDKPDGVRNFKYPKCEIGNDVWIASGVNILRKVKIGDGAVIGAGALVTKDVEPYSIVIGSPAKHYKFRFNEEVRNTLLEIKWWDWPYEIIRENVSLLHDDLDEDKLKRMIEISEITKETRK
ncbi:MAG: CatB-related O-acetyltransferase [Anaerovoracaceae bacterium]